MFNRRPEIHRHRPDLDLCLDLLWSIQRLHVIINDQMVTAIAALFLVCNIIFDTFDFHVRTTGDQIRNSLDIFHKLTDDPDAGDIFYLFFHFLKRNFLSFHFFQNTGNAFYTPCDLFDGRIQSPFPVLQTQMLELFHQFCHCLFVGTEYFTP